LASGGGAGHSSSGFGMSPFARMNSVGQSSLYDFSGTSNMSPSSQTNPNTIVASMMEVQRLREENSLHKATLANYEEKLAQAMNVCLNIFYLNFFSQLNFILFGLKLL
jgi:hypothetical protein